MPLRAVCQSLYRASQPQALSDRVSVLGGFRAVKNRIDWCDVTPANTFFFIVRLMYKVGRLQDLPLLISLLCYQKFGTAFKNVTLTEDAYTVYRNFLV